MSGEGQEVVINTKRQPDKMPGTMATYPGYMTCDVSSQDTAHAYRISALDARPSPNRAFRPKILLSGILGADQWYDGYDDCVRTWRIRIISLMSAHIP
jgi:hypothetical protein